MKYIIFVIAMAVPLTVYPCANYSTLTKNLTRSYGENLLFRGFAEGTPITKLREVWVGPQATWSIVLREASILKTPAGQYVVDCARVESSGKGWSHQPRALLPDSM